MKLIWTVLLLSGCAYTAETVKTGSDADLCNKFFYRGAPDFMSQVVYEELQKRDAPCLKYGSVHDNTAESLMLLNAGSTLLDASQPRVAPPINCRTVYWGGVYQTQCQ